MEDMTEKGCLECGSVLPPEALFCHNCGAKCGEEKNRTKTCAACGAQLLADSKFCSMCGEKSEPEQVDLVSGAATAPENKRARGTGFVKLAVQKGVLAFLSLLMLVFAFMPIMKVSVKTSVQEKGEISISAVDTIRFYLDSLNTDSEAAMDFKEELAEYYDEVYYNEYLDDEERIEAWEKLRVMQFRNSLLNDSYSLGVSGAVCAVVSVLYVLFMLTVATVSLVDLILFLLKGKEHMKFNPWRVFFCIIPVAALLLYIIVYITYRSELIRDSMLLSESSVTVGVVLTLVISSMILVYASVERIFFTNRKKIKAGEIVKRSLSIVGVAVLLFSVLLPVFNVKIRAKFKNSDGLISNASVSRGYEFFSVFGYEAIEKVAGYHYDNNYAEICSTYSRMAEQYTRRQVANGEADMYVDSMVATSAVSWWDSNYVWVYKEMSSLGILIALLAGALMWQNLYAVVSGVKPKRSISKTLSIVAFIVSLVALSFSIFTVEFCNYNLQESLGNMVGWRRVVSIGGAPIAGLLFSAFMIAMSCFERRKLTVKDE